MPPSQGRTNSCREDGLGAARGIVVWFLPAMAAWIVIVAVIVWAV